VTHAHVARRSLAIERKAKPLQRPALTGAARIGHCDVRAGAKERAPPGPNNGTGAKGGRDALRRHMTPRKHQGARSVSPSGIPPQIL